MDDEITFAEYDVTCRTTGCENNDITIRVLADSMDPQVFCGPCSSPITDIVPVTE